MSRGEYLTVLILVVPAVVLGWIGGWLWANRLASKPPPPPRELDPPTRLPTPPRPVSRDGDQDGFLSPTDGKAAEAEGSEP